jgi:hypothetical protein
MIRGITHHALEHRHNVIAGRLTKGRKQSISFADAAMLHEWRHSLVADPSALLGIAAP